jgi:hypothetical protein
MHLDGPAADRDAERLVAKTDAEVGSRASIKARITGTAYSPVAAGSPPGPSDRNTPSGLSPDREQGQRNVRPLIWRNRITDAGRMTLEAD